MYAYYNEWDPFAAAWLRELIADKLIMDGEVDERSITDVEAIDLVGFERVHLFAGIGGWDRALTLAGWEGPILTASCPCQPLSCAGKQRGEKDERHLWPELYRIISELRPRTAVGEQVGSKIGVEWVAGIQLDLEELDYAVAVADIPAAGVGALHIRQRLWWVAERRMAEDAHCIGRGRRGYGDSARDDGQIQVAGLGAHGRVAESNGQGLPQRRGDGRVQRQALGASEGKAAVCGVNDGGMADAERTQEHQEQQRPATPEGRRCADGSCGCGTHSRLGIPNSTGPQPGSETTEAAGYGHPVEPAGFWSDSIWHPCRDGKSRRIPAQSALFPLASRLPNRVGILRGAGNAIVAQVGAEFIKAYMETSQCVKQ